MNPLFSKSSLMILESLSFTKTLYAFDFDGTLSKIVRDPESACMIDSTAKLIRELSGLAPVAIVSGRSLDDLKRRLPCQLSYLVGNHGLEGLGKNGTSLVKAQETCRTWRPSLLNVDLGNGVEVEDKQYSLAIHYRKSRNKKVAKEKIRNIVDKLDPVPRIIAGKSVINLLPATAPHKGMAVLEILEKSGASHVFYIGDDDTDEDVFSLPDERIMTVRVGEKRSSLAKFYVKRQSEINQLLKLIIRYRKKS